MQLELSDTSGVKWLQVQTFHYLNSKVQKLCPVFLMLLNSQAEIQPEKTWMVWEEVMCQVSLQTQRGAALIKE